MAVRFKFRSSLSFDTVDIEGRPSISIRDLKSKIIRFKNLNLFQDFDLVLSDALTGQGQLFLNSLYLSLDFRRKNSDNNTVLEFELKALV